tara:strand:+ start:2003 stop:2746 length:744 start_codon:yes stop_codon:yes gene_type:complete
VTSATRYLIPNWPAPKQVKAYCTTRQHSASSSKTYHFNLAQHVGDTPNKVEQNRQQLIQDLDLPQSPLWLNQVHGTQVIAHTHEIPKQPPTADALYSTHKHEVCAVMTADCLPVLFCDQQGTWVACAHAGWRGLCAGILEQTVAQYPKPAQVMAYLGPAISRRAFEVGHEVRDAFIAVNPNAAKAFTPSGDRFHANLYALAKQRLQAIGVTQVYGGQYCTYHDSNLFFSYRKQQITGRQASLIWLST